MRKLEFTLDSREVAAMVGKEHRKLLRDIRTYIEQVNEINQKAFEEGRGETNIGLSEFFQESSYISEQGKILPCYEVTKKGCEFIAHKLTGIKGTEFSMRYINRFYEMEEALKSNQNFYKVKDTSLGDIAKFVREMDKVMRDQNCHPSDIAEAFQCVCDQFGIQLPECFVKEPTMKVEPCTFHPLNWVTGNKEDDNVDVDYDY